MSSLRIAIVGTSLDIVGGQGIQGRRLVEGLEAEGVRVSFVAINPQFPRALGWVRKVPVLRTLLNQLLYVPRLFRLWDADVVHVFSGSYWSFLLAPVPALLAARAFNKHVVLNYHSGEADDHLANWGPLVHPWLRMANDVVVPSTYLRDVFAHYGYLPRVIANVVDLSSFQYRERTPLRARVLSTRNLERYYRIDLVIEAFARFAREVPSATLTIAGYGSQERRLRALAASLGCEGITFVGKVEPGDMPALYADHDIFVNASCVDNQPVSILEAFASGLPVVSTAVGDIPYLVKSTRTGLLADAEPGALAQAMKQIWSDPVGARAMAHQAREAVTQFTWPAVRHQWLELYSSRTHVHEIAISAESR